MASVAPTGPEMSATVFDPALSVSPMLGATSEEARPDSADQVLVEDLSLASEARAVVPTEPSAETSIPEEATLPKARFLPTAPTHFGTASMVTSDSVPTYGDSQAQHLA